ncbi:hypothetical protein AX16_003782 [Volvariella volvacea WC 439]|nr:hypothetical protein AX16_003782 [Volvariella volvacea WC 439]
MKLGFPFVSLLTLILVATTSVAVRNPIYVIRNAERPALGLEGFTEAGLQRATTCVRNYFGPGSQHPVGLVISCKRALHSNICHAAYGTAAPVAQALGLEVNESCYPEGEIYENEEVDDPEPEEPTTPTEPGSGEEEEDEEEDEYDDDDQHEECLSNVINNFAMTSTQGILIVWDADYMDDIFDNFESDISNLPKFPTEHADVIFTIRNDIFIGQTSMECEGIDGTVDYPVAIAPPQKRSELEELEGKVELKRDEDEEDEDEPDEHEDAGVDDEEDDDDDEDEGDEEDEVDDGGENEPDEDEEDEDEDGEEHLREQQREGHEHVQETARNRAHHHSASTSGSASERQSHERLHVAPEHRPTEQSGLTKPVVTEQEANATGFAVESEAHAEIQKRADPAVIAHVEELARRHLRMRRIYTRRSF